MRKMKDSGVEWIGEIPEDWEVKPLKYLGRFSSSGIDKKIVKNEDLVKIINYVDVYNNPNFELYNGNYMTVSASKNQIKEHLVNKGDLIFTPSSETVEEIGMSALVMEDLENTAFSYHVIRFVFNNDNDVFFRYRRYLCNNSYVYNHFMILAKGTTRKTLKRSDFNDTKVILPPLKTQIKIASHLDNKLIEISNVKEAIVEELQTLEVYKKSVITEAVTKGLDKNAEMKDSGIEWIGEIPKHWKLKRIRNITTKSERGTSPTYTTDETLSKVVNQATFSSGYFDKSNIRFSSIPAKESKGLLEKGDVLIASTGGGILGKTHYFMEDEEYVADGHVTVMRTNPSIQNSKLLFYIFSINYDLINGVLAKGSTNQTELQSVWLNNFKIPCPDVTEQEEIVSYLDKKTQAIDEVIAIKQNQLSLLDEYKKSLIYEYVTGKREV